MRRALLLLGAALAGCGGSESGVPSVDSSQATEDAFVPPRDADILLAPLTWSDGLPTLGAPRNVTRRPGYDNQPAFLSNEQLLYTALDEQSGQTDIWMIHTGPGTVERVTASAPESEYSATPLPDGSGISTIRVEADSAQRLWRFDLDGAGGEVLLPEIAPVGYHAWVDEVTVVMFVLGSPPTLRVGDLRTGRARVAAENIGRGLGRIPDSFDATFVQLNEDGEATLMRLPGDGGEPTTIVEALSGSQDFAWAPNGTLLMATGSTLYAFRPDRDEGWHLVADLQDLHVDLTRLAVSPNGEQIAMVAELTPLELETGN